MFPKWIKQWYVNMLINMALRKAASLATKSHVTKLNIRGLHAATKVPRNLLLQT